MIGFAVIGCGRIGSMHARNLRRNGRARLVALHDAKEDVAGRLAGELGVAARPLEDVLGDPSVEAVLIASSTDTHVPLILAAARAGKAVFCEKPVDIDTSKALECRAALAGTGVPVMIGFNRRFDPSFAALAERLGAGEIGRLELLVLTNRDPDLPPPGFVGSSGGLFRDFTIHDFDMARHLAGEIVEVHAFGANLIDPSIAEEGDIDTAMVTLRAASGALVHVNNSRRCAYGYDQRVEAFGAKGMLGAGNRRGTTVEAWTASATACRDPVLPNFTLRYAEAYRAEIEHFLDCLTTGGTPSVGIEDGIAAMRIADAAETSAREGRSVRLDRRAP